MVVYDVVVLLKVEDEDLVDNDEDHNHELICS